MADYLYLVDLSASAETASNPKYVDRLLVQLMCDHNRGETPLVAFHIIQMFC